MRGLK